MNVEFAKEILKVLNENEECADYLALGRSLSNCDDDVFIVEDSIRKALKDAHIGNFFCSAGATKFVVVFERAGFALKIPMDCQGDYNYDTEEYDYIDFHHANDYVDTSSEWNYCEVEKTLYNYAKEEHLDMFFPETFLLGYVEERPIYIQEFAMSCGDGGSSGSTPSDFAEENASSVIATIQRSCGDYNTLPKDWVCAAIDNYGLDALMALSDFLCENYITDLHDGNIGFNNDGLPVIIDFSSFNENY